MTAFQPDTANREFRQALEQKAISEGSKDISSHKTTRITSVCVDDASSLLGKSVGDVKSDRIIILGVERGKETVKNPVPAFVFQPGDVVWMVAAN